MIDGNVWDYRLVQFDPETQTIEVEIHSKGFYATLGKVSHLIQVGGTKAKEAMITWTISYTSDLCPSVLKSMQEKRMKVLSALEETHMAKL